MEIFEFLNQNGISYDRCDHPPVYTCEEAERLVPELPGHSTKNLFLRDHKGKRHLLVVMGDRQKIDLKKLADQIGIGRLSFASAERLKKYLGIEPGAVSLLALLNDEDRVVETYIDRKVWEAEALCCHPLVNSSTLVISKGGIEKFLQATGHVVRFIDL